MSILSEANSNPYLKAHGLDLVDWRPWESTSIFEAKELGSNSVINRFFGSSGCKTMLKESFFNESTAEVINSAFFPIKVDKDSQPEIAKTYQMPFNFDKKPYRLAANCFLRPRKPYAFLEAPFLVSTRPRTSPLSEIYSFG